MFTSSPLGLRAVAIATTCLFVAACELFAQGSIITTRSGIQYQGKAARIGSINENPLAGEVSTKPIVLIDDELRRTFIPFRRVEASVPSPASGHERILIRQRVASVGRGIGNVGLPISISPFDEYGRRTFSMQGPRGNVDVIQGITELTPTYTKVQGLAGFVWDMRLATSSIPRETLSNILMKRLNQEDPDDRLKIVNLYLQSERFRDALLELEGVIADFPTLKHLQNRATSLRQLYSQQLLREIGTRRDAGQHERVNALLDRFPTEGIAGITLLRVRDMLGEYNQERDRYNQLTTLLEQQINAVDDPVVRNQLDLIRAEIFEELNFNTLDRMADYLRFVDSEDMGDEQKIALAVSGWLLGSGAATQNLAVALSLFTTRNAVHDYLSTDRPDEQEASLDIIRSEEGGAPAYVAKLIAHMLPPRVTQAAVVDNIPGYHELTVGGIKEQPEFTYFLQLPPEYDSHRRYPCVVTLNGGGTNPQQQIDWWTGNYSKRAAMRQGQAARQGFIVLAPVWTKPLQREYEYTSREHAAVLFCLRDACRRTSIDTDRVFLSGHSMGGEAAWDIGLAHPDLWAGVIPLVAGGAKYIHQYHENGRELPMYFVGGEKDRGWLNRNGVEFDRYLRYGYDVTVVQYQGRGHEHFQDEVQRIFDWMSSPANRRSFFPHEFETVSMRPWDNFFWWIELSGFPARTMVMPAAWVKGSKRPSRLTAQLLDNQRISVKTASNGVTIWLSPELVDFDREIEIVVNSRRIREEIAPDVEVLLEDVRTRGDRQHPFWTKVKAAARGR